MTKPKMLFVDDDHNGRIKPAIEKYSSEFDVDIATCVPRALRMMISKDYDIISLDFDLNGYDFQDPDEKTCGMEIVRYITRCGYPVQRETPTFWIHSTNLFGANLMHFELTKNSFPVRVMPFNWKKYQNGVIAGAFDVIHPGYISMFKDAKDLCHKLTILVHNKPNQVFSLNDRVLVLNAIEYVDYIDTYSTEDELTNLFLNSNFDVRIVGSDHRGKSSRPDLPFPTVYHERNEGWSATKYKKMIFENIQGYVHDSRIA